MPEQPKLSYECRHQLAEWVRLHCPCATENTEFLRGLLVIVERELVAAQRRPSVSADDPNPLAGRDGGPA